MQSVQKLLPVGTRRRKFASKVLKAIGWKRINYAGMDEYQLWIQNMEQKTLELKTNHPYSPLISIIVPAFNTPDKYLKPLISSFINQTYKNWQLCLVNGSTDKERYAAIKNIAAQDDRITHIPLTENLGIAGNTNEGIKRARGEFVAFTDHDDTLAPFALNEVVVKLNKDKNIDVFYSDEDKLSDDGRFRLNPFFKPGWSPELFHTVNYLAHFVVVRTSIVKKVGGIRTGYDGAQDFDFLLRVFDETQNVHHVPHISYHWRLAEGSTAKDTGEKNYADDAGQRALKDYVKRNKINAKVLPFDEQSTVYRLQYGLEPEQDVYVVSGNGLLLGGLGRKIKVINLEEAGKKIFGDKDVVVFVADNLQPDKESILELAAVASQDGIGVVGGWVKQNDRSAIGYACQSGKIQPIFQGQYANEWTHMGQPQWPRNLIFPSEQFFAVRASLHENLRPFELFVKVTQKGYRNIFWPFSQVRASGTYGVNDYSCKLRDPYINPNLVAMEDKLVLKE